MLIVIFFHPAAAFASGFQIPNQSVVAVGIAGAHIAYTPGPDSAYYNPANMSFLSDSWKLEASLTALGLPSIDYTDNRSPLLNGSSDSELFFLPQLHTTSKNYQNFRFGFSLTYPFGLSKSWDQPFPAVTAREFSLFVIEGNPSLSYLISDKLSIGGGLRVIYSDGEVKNSAINTPFSPLSPLTALNRKMDGDDLQTGYNLAVTLQPAEQWTLVATYRSKVELDLSGDSSLQALSGEKLVADYHGSGELAVPLPAVFSLATSVSLNDLTLEITWNRTFWSSFKKIDFQYNQSFIGSIFDGFDRPVEKNWEDSDALRFGLTYKMMDKLTTTLGFAIDKTPVPESTLGFEMPDSDAFMYSAGLQYNPTRDLILATSYMYHHTTSRSVTNQPPGELPAIYGTFTDGGAHAVTIGIIYSF